MRPILFRLPDWLGGVAVPSYGVMLLLGVLIGAIVFAWLAHLAGRDRGKAFEIMLEAILVALVASKLANVLFVGGSDPGGWLIGSGGVWYVGFLAGVAYFSWRGRHLGFTTAGALDHAVPAVAIGHALGRVGCLLTGCCWGARCDLPWAITYTSEVAHERIGVPLGVPMHPTPVYEAGSELLLGVMLALLVATRKLRFEGQAVLVYLVAYALLRIGFETLRDDPRGAIGPLSTSQAIGIAVLLVAVPLLVRGWLRGSLDLHLRPSHAHAGGGGSHRGGGAGATSASAAHARRRRRRRP